MAEVVTDPSRGQDYVLVTPFTGDPHHGFKEIHGQLSLRRRALRGGYRFEARHDSMQLFYLYKSARLVRVGGPRKLSLNQGADAQTKYEWTPPGHPSANLHFQFCRTCGIRTVGRGDHGPQGGPFYFVAVASLDDFDPDDLASSIRYVDGKHDRFDQSPKDTRLL